MKKLVFSVFLIILSVSVFGQYCFPFKDNATQPYFLGCVKVKQNLYIIDSTFMANSMLYNYENVGNNRVDNIFLKKYYAVYDSHKKTAFYIDTLSASEASFGFTAPNGQIMSLWKDSIEIHKNTTVNVNLTVNNNAYLQDTAFIGNYKSDSAAVLYDVNRLALYRGNLSGNSFSGLELINTANHFGSLRLGTLNSNLMIYEHPDSAYKVISSNSLKVYGNAYIDDNLYVNGNTYIGNGATDTLFFNLSDTITGFVDLNKDIVTRVMTERLSVYDAVHNDSTVWSDDGDTSRISMLTNPLKIGTSTTGITFETGGMLKIKNNNTVKFYVTDWDVVNDTTGFFSINNASSTATNFIPSLVFKTPGTGSSGSMFKFCAPNQSNANAAVIDFNFRASDGSSQLTSARPWFVFRRDTQTPLMVGYGNTSANRTLTINQALAASPVYDSTLISIKSQYNLNNAWDFLCINQADASAHYWITSQGQTMSTNNTHIVDSIYTRKESSAIADDGTITLTASQAGFGEVYAFLTSTGAFVERARFYFDEAGTVVLVDNSANVVTADTDANLCIITGNPVVIKNRLGYKHTLKLVINYSAN